MSDSLMHWDDYVIYISESKRRDEYTFRRSKIMAEDHKFIEGPKQAKNTGMIYYLEQYECSNNDYGPVEEDDNNDAQSNYSNELSKKDFKGFSIVLTPPADRSFLEILPQFNTNYNNFVSYIDSENIIARYSGRFFVFHNKGQFLGQVLFDRMDNSFQQEKLQIVCISDSMEYFVFEGPEFTEKQDKKSKDKKRKTKMTKVKSQQMFYVFRLEFET